MSHRPAHCRSSRIFDSPGHQLEHVAGQPLDEVERAAHGVLRERVDAGTEDELAAVGLADVDVQRP